MWSRDSKALVSCGGWVWGNQEQLGKHWKLRRRGGRRNQNCCCLWSEEKSTLCWAKVREVSVNWLAQQNTTKTGIWNSYRAPPGRITPTTSSWRPPYSGFCMFQAWRKCVSWQNQLASPKRTIFEVAAAKNYRKVLSGFTALGKSTSQRALSKNTCFTGTSGQALPKKNTERASDAKSRVATSRFFIQKNPLLWDGPDKSRQNLKHPHNHSEKPGIHETL